MGLFNFLFGKLIDKRIAKYQNNLIDQQCIEVENMYRTMRGWRHDYHNHIQTMKAYLKMNKLDELDEYLNKLDTDLTTVDTVIKTGNLMIDAILNSKLSIFKANNISVNAKSAIKFIKEIISIIYVESMKIKDIYKLEEKLKIYKNQQIIRKFLEENNYVSFIANKSIIPRIDGTNLPDSNAISFKSPKLNEIKIPVMNNEILIGMGIKKGITILTGGGYSGKTTILEGIERGIYDHEMGDGREYCITINNAIKIQAEDGRYISHANLSAFFRYIGLNKKVNDFSTDDASGSVSEATNIVEAINFGSKLLLIDEDKSATNFMIKDDIVKKIIKNDPIIPFTDRIVEIYERFNISTIVVVGGSSEYFKYANDIILLNKFKLTNITKKCELFVKKENTILNKLGKFTQKYKLLVDPNNFIYYKVVKNDHSKSIIIGNYKADITNIQGIKSDYQFNYISRLLLLILSRNEYRNVNLYQAIVKNFNQLNNENLNEIFFSNNMEQTVWFEQIRVIDLMNVLIRLRGLELK